MDRDECRPRPIRQHCDAMHQPAAPASDRSSTFHETPSERETCGALLSRKRKRSREERIEEDDGDEDEDDEYYDSSPPNVLGKKRSLDAPTQGLLACPYAKHNIWKHQECLGLKLGKFSYLKQHLVRAHSAATYCPRCGQEFPGSDSASELNRHLSQVSACKFRTFSLGGKMTSETKNKVLDAKERKGANGRKLNDEEKWFRVYGILFPDAVPPKSPYAESQAVGILQAFSASMRQEMGSHVLGRVDNQGLSRGDSIRFVEDVVTTFMQYMHEGDKLSPGSRDLLPTLRGISSSPENSMSPVFTPGSSTPEIRSRECSCPNIECYSVLDSETILAGPLGQHFGTFTLVSESAGGIYTEWPWSTTDESSPRYVTYLWYSDS